MLKNEARHDETYKMPYIVAMPTTATWHAPASMGFDCALASEDHFLSITNGV